MSSTDKKKVWVDTGYRLFSTMGKKCLSVELLSRETGKSKSSFYHYFGDMDTFMDTLLDNHVERMKKNASDIRNAKQLLPDVMNIYLDRSVDSFFHKQLRIHRENPAFLNCINTVKEFTQNSMISKWKIALNLESQSFLIKSYLDLISENFFLRITPETFTAEWLKNYVTEMCTMFLKAQKEMTQK